MAVNKINSASGTSNDISVEEMKQWFSANKKNVENYASAERNLKLLRDATQSYAKNISTFDKELLRTYMKNIASNEKSLRGVSRFLFYRSHIYFRLVRFYASMPDLGIRTITPNLDISNKNLLKKDDVLKTYLKIINLLDSINLQSHSEQIWEKCLIEDVCYGLYFFDKSGSFAYFLDSDYCKINGYWATNTLSFSMNMSYWDSKKNQQQLEWLGDPLASAYKEYQKTKKKWQPIDISKGRCYPFCFKFRMDDLDTIIPPFLSLFLSLINNSDLESIQAVADQQQIYKLVYYPIKTINGSKESDNFSVSIDLAIQYFNRLLNEALPEYAAGAVIPGDELKVIDFSNSADTDTNRVQNSQDTILNTSGGGMVLNTSRITTQAGFEAALKCETEFALSSLLPQIDGFVNLITETELGEKGRKVVHHLEESVYTKGKFAETVLKSNQYSFSNRLLYNSCLGISEKTTLINEYLENDVLELPALMNHPLSSSFTSSGTDDGYTSEIGQGRPTKDAGDLSDDGSKSRDR